MASEQSEDNRRGERMASGRSTMTRLWRFAVTMATLVMALSLAACGDDDGIEAEDQSTEAGVAEAEGEPSGELVIANWPLYIDKQTIPEFEGETGISVKYVEEIN